MKDELDYVVLEDQRKYVIVDAKTDVETYYYLAAADNIKDVCIRKFVLDDSDYMLSGLDNEQELQKALNLFGKCR